MTPSAASSRASLPRAVLEIRMEASMASSVSTRSATIPTGMVESWNMNTRGAFPSTGREPRMKRTVVPSETVAQVSYGTAIASMRRSPVVPSALAAATVTLSEVKRIMVGS